MSEIKNVGQTWMALNTFKCNHLMQLHLKGLKECTNCLLRFRLVDVINQASCRVFMAHHVYINIIRDVTLTVVLRNRLRPVSAAKVSPKVICSYINTERATVIRDAAVELLM